MSTSEVPFCRGTFPLFLAATCKAGEKKERIERRKQGKNFVSDAGLSCVRCAPGLSPTAVAFFLLTPGPMVVDAWLCLSPLTSCLYSQGEIHRVKTDGTNRTVFAPLSLLGSSMGLAFDWISRNMYYTTPASQSIEVMIS